MKACEYIGISPEIKYKPLNISTEKSGQNEIKWEPREISFPSLTWQNKGSIILFQAFKYLLSSQGKKHRRYLNNRGISDSTIKKARIGYISKSITFDAESWGLAPENNETGKKRKIWLPEGIIIPQFYNQKLICLQVRQENPLSINRFIMISGSAMGYFDYTSHLNPADIILSTPNKPWIVTESRLDGWLLQQSIGAACRVFAIGNSSARPDRKTHNFLLINPGLVNLDNDEAGRNEAKWWKEHYPKSITHFSEKKKDPGEDFEAGVNIKKWIMSGLSKLNIIPDTDIKQSKQSKDFKNTTLKNYKNRFKSTNSTKKNTKSVKKSTNEQSRLCVHNLFCYALKDEKCLINKQNPFEKLICPKDYWHTFKTGNIIEIILSPGVNK